VQQPSLAARSQENEKLLKLVRSLFDIDGRLSRGGFLLFVLASSVYVLPVMWVLRDELPRQPELFFLFCSPMIGLSVLAGIRRLHDRGLSGWWFPAFYVAPFLLLSPVPWFLDFLRADGYPESATRAVFFAFAALAMLPRLWACVELYFLRGTRGPNRFGADPLDRG
jgi:uncharacterized membrane protein YhaH (DUF805 family)